MIALTDTCYMCSDEEAGYIRYALQYTLNHSRLAENDYDRKQLSRLLNKFDQEF